MSIIPAFTILNKIENKVSKETIIKLNSKVLIIDSQRRFPIDQVKKFQVRISSRNFPAIIIYLKDGKKHIIQCAEKYNLNFTEFVAHFEKLVET
ncbi:hypothetical protein [Kordia sp.]|uniref:hypothetical protein n=1 Tax=Kordia sp. TaxID=1965332 RepID=UPI003D6A8FA4